ncbi:MAG: redoxin domain-containing protein [Bacteroidaceae bacterium]|jgi:peroxiredoxin|nr:redoxin domain-containing protein [Bacteroidaceae bacterium]
MKKLFYVGALAALTACTGNNGYTIKGEIADAQDGDSIFLVEMSGRQSAKQQGTIIKNGKFEFKGEQANPELRYLMYQPGTENDQAMDFFLENGTIMVKMSTDVTSATGTPNNDAYQQIRDEIYDIQEQMNDVYEKIANEEDMSDETRANIEKLSAELEDKYVSVLVKGAKNNATNEVGMHMLKNFYFYMNTPDLAEIVQQIPDKFLKDESINRIKEVVTKLTATEVGKKFTDFELKDPDGKPVKLSDYAGKGKVVLVDFWASWCGPCRQEMPNVVKVYNQYKKKGFEIVGVSLDQTAEAWKKGIADLNITWPQMSDLKYWQCEAAAIYGVSAIPHTVLIDKDGTILERNLRGEKLYERIAELLD